MRFQKVSVDVWRIVTVSASCLFLAFMAWIFLKLAYACVWLPGYLKTQAENEKDKLNQIQNEDYKDNSEDDEELKKIQ